MTSCDLFRYRQISHFPKLFENDSNATLNPLKHQQNDLIKQHVFL